MQKKRVVVLGGVGLIGSHLIEKLLARGEEVFCVDKRDLSSSPILSAIKNDAFHYVKHDITTPYTIRCDEIYNLVSPARLSYDRQLPVETLKSYLLGSINTLEIARSEFTRVVFGSSSKIYAQRSSATYRDNTPIIEGVSSAEAIHRAYFSEYGVDSRIARIFNTYGSGCDIRDRRVVMRMVTSALQNRDIVIFGDGEQKRTLCWAGDIADALIKMMGCPSDSGQIVADLGDDSEISIRSLAEKIIEITGSRSRIIHEESRQGDRQSIKPNLATSARLLGWHSSTPLNEGLLRTIEYVERRLASYRGTSKSWIEIYS